MVGEWNTFVVENFHGHQAVAESTYNHFVHQAEQSTSSSSVGFVVSPIRTCTVPWKTILRELNPEDKSDFMRRLNDSAVKATNYTVLLSPNTRALMLGIAERGFDVKINSDTSVTVEL